MQGGVRVMSRVAGAGGRHVVVLVGGWRARARRAEMVVRVVVRGGRGVPFQVGAMAKDWMLAGGVVFVWGKEERGGGVAVVEWRMQRVGNKYDR